MALRANDRYVVHGLDTSAKNIKRAREHIMAKGLYGKVTLEKFDGKELPLIDNLVKMPTARNPTPGRIGVMKSGYPSSGKRSRKYNRDTDPISRYS